MRIFDYSFLNNGFLPSGLVNLTGDIYALRSEAAIRKESYVRVFTELESVAKIQSVKSSNAIEGIITTDSRIKEIVQNNSAPLNHNEVEIAGYRDALNVVHQNYETIDFKETDILNLHDLIFSFTGSPSAGVYKKTDNLIIETSPNGFREIRFRPMAAKETPLAMQQLELAYMDAKDNFNINQLLLIPCVILDFLCIHPFQDGNGRISRLLSLLLLYKNGFDAGKYISFEEQINRYKTEYYDALKASSKGWEKNQNDYFPFIQNFLSVLYMCYKELDKRFAIVHGKKVTKKKRIEATVTGSLTAISKAEICAIHPDISPSTVEAVLGAMVKAGKIKKIGAARGTKYLRK